LIYTRHCSRWIHEIVTDSVARLNVTSIYSRTVVEIEVRSSSM
jgi:hypothetical protein